MVFTACRLWYRANEHQHCTKSAAARWVMHEAPELRAPRLALENRSSDAHSTIPEVDVMTLLARVRTLLADRSPTP
jgi:hypothetical protein